MAACSTSPVDLGFTEDVGKGKWRLFSHMFPSKIGGCPAWLVLKPLPTFEELKCKRCEEICVFLLQIYAPVSEKEECFHRTLFLFACRNPTCYTYNSNNSFLVLRSQLARTNEFYSCDPPNENYFDSKQEYPNAARLQNICVVCGCVGPKQCSKCHEATYCDKSHQVIHWKNGHKEGCGKKTLGEISCETSSKLLFPELEIVMEEEKYEEKADTKSEEDKMKEYQEYLTSIKQKESLAADDLDAVAKHETKEDKQFLTFKKRIRHEPEQILRYDRGGEPLWVSSEHIPKLEDIPKCSCGSSRRYEFQVLPQLLSHLDVDQVGDSIDWGTLVIYTCSNSCVGSAYMPEFIWKQDFSRE